LHRLKVVVRLVAMRRVVDKPAVAGVRVLAMRLRVRALEPVERLVLARAAAEVVALAEVDVAHECFRVRTPFV
jgi:hypothetical protein